MGEKLERYIQNAPKPLNVEFNPIINALLQAWAQSDEDLVTQIDNSKDQLFVPTANGSWLDRRASDLGVPRPTSLGISDTDFQKLIPNLSLKAKQIRSIFYDTMDVFWGPLFSRANLTSGNFAPFNVSPGDILQVEFDGQVTESVRVFTTDIVTPGAATADEVVALLGRLKRGTPSVLEDAITGHEFINLRTNTPGSRGIVQVLGGNLSTSGKLNFSLNAVNILDLAQRTVIYEITPRELIIEIPASVPTLRKDLKGSHHFHQDSTLASPVPPNDGIWQGSFFYDPQIGFTVTSQNARIQEVIQKGQVVTKVTVDDASKIPNAPGFLIFDFGTGAQESPVPYLGVSNNQTVLINAAHVFQHTHNSSAFINVISPTLQGYEPNTDGQDLAIYMTSPVNDRTIVQGLLEKLVAAGVIITFKILLPNYKYLIINPYEYFGLIDPSGA